MEFKDRDLRKSFKKIKHKEPKLSKKQKILSIKSKTIINDVDKKNLEVTNISSLKNPDHRIHIKRVHQVLGQIQGVERMINDGRYCPEIIAQIRAAHSALKAIESEIFKTHLRRCVKATLSGGDTFETEEKIQEIIKLIYK